jgi:hypothetical protein
MPQSKRPFFEYGFWWHWNAARNDWFIGGQP